MHSKHNLNFIIAVMVTLFLLPIPAQTSRNVRALFIVPNEFGANTNLNKDNFENLGWDITYAGTTKIVNSCPWAEYMGIVPFTVDSLVSEIKSAMSYDCIIITSASASSPSGNPCSDLMESDDVTRLLNEAMDGGIVISAYCTAVRVLASAGVVNGKKITGNQIYLSEYENAGAIFQGPKSLPVIDGNIVTSVRGDYYYIQNSNAIADAVEQNGLNPAITHLSSPANIYNNQFEHEDIIWAKTIGGEASDLCKDIYELDDDNMLLVGTTYSEGAGSSDMFVKKVDASGNEIWSTVFGGQNREFGNSITILNNFIYASGITTSSGNGKKDYYLAKLDMDGSLVWTKTYGGNDNDICRKIISTSSGELIMCGETFSSGEGEDDLLLVKVDENGNQLVYKDYGYVESEMAFDVIETSDGNLLVTGASGHFSDKRDLWLIKMDQDGNLIWDKNYGINDDNDWGFKVLEYGSNYYVCGKSDKHGNDFYTAAITKTDLDGNFIYMNKYGENKLYEFGEAFAIHDSLITIAGIQKSYELSNEMFVITTSLDGEVEEEELRSSIQLSNAGSDWVNSLLITKDGNYVIAGQTNSLGNGAFDIFLIKLSSLTADFDVNRRSGHAPLEIHYINKSFGPIFSSSWDFNNDNIFDSNEENPVEVYNEPGIYTSELEITSDGITRSVIKEDYIKVFDGESCIGFPQTGSHILCSSSLLPNFDTDFTFEMWINTEDLSRPKRIVDKNSIFIQTIGNYASFENCYLFKIFLENGNVLTTATPNNSLVPNAWQHLSMAYSQEGNLSVYINGVLQELSTPAENLGAISDNSETDLIIGNNSSLMANYTGLIDEIRFWDYYRTTDQIISDFKTYLTGFETGLLLYLNLNEGWGNVANNLAANNSSVELNETEWYQSVNINTIVSVDDSDEIPVSFSLQQNYPNPFNPATTINYQIANPGKVKLTVYDVLGELVNVLVNEEKPVGSYSVNFNAASLASGIYFYQLSTQDFVCTKKMMLIK